MDTLRELVDTSVGFPNSALRAMARIILHGSEIDHAISLALFKLSKISEEDGFALLGMLQISAKLEKLRYFIEKYGENFP